MAVHSVIDLRADGAAQHRAMTSLPNALVRAIAQLSDPAILRVLAKSLVATLAIFAALGAGAYALLAGIIGRWTPDYGAQLGALVAILLTIIGGWLLFRLVALAVLQFFADGVVHAVEARHYPAELAKARSLRWQEELRGSLTGLGRALLANLIALPFAIALLVTGIGTALLFWAVNAWLLGRELQDMVWLRHCPSSSAASPMAAGTRFALGGVIAFLLIIPFVNLLAPVIGAAAATHLVHRRKGFADVP